MTTGRYRLGGLVLLTAFASMPLSKPSQAITLPLAGASGFFAGPQIDLADRLATGLKARRPSEFAFIAKVVAKVRSRELPIKLVDGTFLWARVKGPVPFPYFQQALRLRAARMGIRL